MPRDPHLHSMTTKVIPGLSAEYQIVSLPYWAWYWLDDFMKTNRISYQGIYETFGKNIATQDDINETLRGLAEIHHDHTMREIYQLANDNEANHGDIMTRIHQTKKEKQPKALVLPKIYKLFGFMACATTLEAVWERRHYRDNNKVK